MTVKFTPDKMAELLAKAKEKKAASAIEDMKAKVREKPKEFPFAPKLPEKPTPPEESTGSPAITKLSLAEKLAALRAKQAAAPTPAPKEEPKEETKHESNHDNSTPIQPSLFSATNNPNNNSTGDSSSCAEPAAATLEHSSNQLSQPIDKYGNLITYNEQQQEFVSIASEGKSCVLIGAAGTGKTTCTQGGIQQLIASGRTTVLEGHDHNHLPHGSPGVIIIAYTRRAVNNIKKVLPADLKDNCITVHKLLEYQPQYFEVEDPETGESKNTMRFEPSRHEGNPLPSTINTIIVEESSMLSLDLFSNILRALVHEVQWVFLGDINQLPPIFGPAILGFKMLEIPVIELTTVYRQALESPIIRLAHRILSGKPIPVEEFPEWKVEGKLTLHPWKKKLSPDTAVMTLAAFFTKAYDSGAYSVEEDMILMPFNKGCGTIELNKYIANHIARKNHEITFEVMAGFNKHYFSVGDKVLYDKEDAEIIEITKNASYTGSRVQPESRTLDYWGHNPNLINEQSSNDYGSDDIDFLLSQVESSEDRVTQSSHNVVVKLLDTGTFVTLNKAADINNLLHSYALTVHKAQGSEWRKVFLTLHQSHATMLQRELLYTAVTRAREELYVICEPESFTKGINSQRIKGNTLAEKAEYFKGKITGNEEILG